MTELNTYFEALELALDAVKNDAEEHGFDQEKSFYWAMIMRSYGELLRPAVGYMPAQAAACVGKALSLWAEHELPTEDDIITHAQKHFKLWFEEFFPRKYRQASAECRYTAKSELERYVNGFLAEKGLPPVVLSSFTLSSFIDKMEEIIRTQALPFMLKEIFSYEFIELDDGDDEDAAEPPQERRQQLEEGKEALEKEKDFRVGFARNYMCYALVNEELLLEFGQEVYHALCLGIEDVKSRLATDKN